MQPVKRASKTQDVKILVSFVLLLSTSSQGWAVSTICVDYVIVDASTIT
jgi:hypothetical protein